MTQTVASSPRYSGPNRHETAAERLARRSRAESSGCILWCGRVNKKGYGAIRFAGVLWKAHRLAWAVARGPIPEGKVICHKCDVPGCINPDHLFLGTVLENNRDRDAKNRQARRLTDEQVIEILQGGAHKNDLAARFGVHPDHITNIRLGRRRMYLGVQVLGAGQ